MKWIFLLICALGTCYAQEETEFRFGTTVVIPTGLQGQIYHINKYAKALPKLEKKKAVGTIYTTSLNIPTQDFKMGFPGVTNRTEGFAIDYTGKFWIQTPGKYRFFLTSDDGSKLFIDDRLVIDNDGVHPTQMREGEIELAGGVHRIHVPYYQGPGYELALILEIQAPLLPRRVFSTDDYKPPSTVESLPAVSH
jgi:hypothetical protein